MVEASAPDLKPLPDKLVQMIPVYEMECLPNEEAARLSYETMRRGAEEAGFIREGGT